MTTDQVTILGLLAATVGMFLWGKWRHDMVAMAALLTCVLAGLVPRAETFVGFGHPAVITVACVLVLSRALQVTGAVDFLTRKLIPQGRGPTLTIAVLSGLAALLSAFMNNVGALALLMPVAIQIARKQGLPPGRVLMPLAFGSILGGMTTMIGTPPNLIVSGFRAEAKGDGFAMFDYSPVGLLVAGCGVIFVALVGWRLVPARERAGVEGFDTGVYLTEARVGRDSKAVGKTLREIGPLLEAADAQVIGMAREDIRTTIPSPHRRIRVGDVLVVECEPDTLATALSSLGLELEEANAMKHEDKDDAPEDGKKPDPEEVTLMELTVRPETALVGRSATDILLRTRYGINLLAMSRKGKRSIRRLRSVRIRAGDVLLMQGPAEAILGFASEYGCIPLAERAIRIPDKRAAIAATMIMAAAVGGAAVGLLPAAISFAAGVLAVMALRVMPLRNVFESIDWPVIVLLGALIPVAAAMETTGAADLIAQSMIGTLATGNPILALTLILIITMTLSDFMNNAATAAVMCPIAISTAALFGVNPDSFLMAVAIGASCAFLTPIGHQNNTLILGPGGFRFGDYWRLGLPLEVLVVVVGIPSLLVFWPL
ncbi:MAG: SLC13 family permease [Luteolibacter sp.]